MALQDFEANYEEAMKLLGLEVGLGYAYDHKLRKALEPAVRDRFPGRKDKLGPATPENARAVIGLIDDRVEECASKGISRPWLHPVVEGGEMQGGYRMNGTVARVCGRLVDLAEQLRADLPAWAEQQAELAREAAKPKHDPEAERRAANERMLAEARAAEAAAQTKAPPAKKAGAR